MFFSPNKSAGTVFRFVFSAKRNEATHFLKQRKKGKVGYAAIKLDMSKAYDRIEWHFLRDIMQRLGFDRRWVNLVTKCVTMVKYRIREGN